MLKRSALGNKLKIDLALNSAYGISYSNVKNSYTIVNDMSVIYFIGSSLIYKNVMTNKHVNFNKKGHFEKVEYVSTFIDSNKKPFVVISETLSNYTLITLLSLDEGKWQDVRINQRLIVRSIKVSMASKLMFLLVNIEKVEEQFVYVWNFVKKKVVNKFTLKHTFTQIDTHPTKSRMLFLFSPNFIKLFEYKQQNRNLIEKVNYLHSLNVKNEHYLDFCWSFTKNGYYLIMVNNLNNFTIFHNDKFLRKLNIDLTILSFTKITCKKNEDKTIEEIFQFNKSEGELVISEEKLEQTTIIKLVKQDKGFLFATDQFHLCYCKIHNNTVQSDFMNNNHIYVVQSYQLDLGRDNEFLTSNKLFSINSNLQSTLLTLSTQAPNENVEHYIFNMSSLDSYKTPLQKFFPINLQKQKILRLSTSRAKNIFVSLDSESGRIWPGENKNTKDFKNIELFNEDSKFMDVTIHPSGFFLAIAIFTGFQVFAILDDHLKLLKHVNLVWCTLIKYSKRAKYLLVNEKNRIYAFDTIHYNIVYFFAGHTILVKELIILEDELRVISFCNNNHLMLWEIIDKSKPTGYEENDTKNQVSVNKHIAKEHYSSFVYDEVHGFFIGTSPSNNFIVYTDACRKHLFTYNNPAYNVIGLEIDSASQLLYASTDQGSVKIYNTNFNFVDSEVITELLSFEIKISNFPLNNVILMNNNKKLAVSGINGSILVYNINYNNKDKGETDQYSLSEKNVIEDVSKDCFLLNSIKINEDKSKIKQLETEIIRLKRVKETELFNLTEKFKQTLAAIDRKFESDNQEMDKEIEEFMKQKENSIGERENWLKENMNKNEEELDKLREKTKYLVEYEQKRNTKLRNQHKEIIENKSKQVAELEANYEKEVATIKENLNKEIEELKKDYKVLQDRSQLYSNKFLEKINFEEEEHEKELIRYTKLLERDYAKEIKETTKIFEENKRLQQNSNKFREEDKKSKQRIQELVEQNTVLLEDKVKHCLSLLKMQEQLLEKEQVLMNKENTIKSSIDVQKSLENFRYILEHKIKEFEGEKDELLEKIKIKEENLKNLFKELLEQSDFNIQLSNSVKVGTGLLSIVNKESEHLELGLATHFRAFDNLWKKIQALVNNKELKVFAKRLKIREILEGFKNGDFEYLNNYAKGNIFNKESKDFERREFDQYNELIRQNYQIFREITKFGKKMVNSKSKFKHKFLLSINKNKNLIEECNKLQVENDYYKKLLRELSNTINHTAKIKLSTVNH